MQSAKVRGHGARAADVLGVAQMGRHQAKAMGLGFGAYPDPKGPKYPNMGVCMASTLGIVIMAFGMYSVFGYLDP